MKHPIFLITVLINTIAHSPLVMAMCADTLGGAQIREAISGARSGNISTFVRNIRKIVETPEGFISLSGHASELEAVIPGSWHSLVTLPEAVSQNIVRNDGGETFECAALAVQMGRSTELNPMGKPTARALGARAFLRSYLRSVSMQSGMAGAVGFTPIHITNSVEAITRIRQEWITDNHLGFQSEASAAVTAPVDAQILGQVKRAISEGEAGIRRLTEELPILERNLLRGDWANVFGLRPMRSPIFLAQGNAMEVVAILRMIRIAKDASVEADLRTYANEWLVALFKRVKPIVSVSIPTLDILEKLYESP